MTMHSEPERHPSDEQQPHPRVFGWVGATAIAMGGSNSSICVIGALLVGQGAIPGQGSAAIPLLIVGLILSCMAAPGWTELSCMFPNRVGGIAATCAEAFRPYSPILASLTGLCYWWGWVPACALGALFSAAVIHDWILPFIPIPLLACLLLLLFTIVNLCGVKWIARMTIPIACISAVLALMSAIIPVVSGHVVWQDSFTWHLTTPFDGMFGQITSVMAGIFLVGWTAPAFEAAFCHVGEMKDPARNVPRAALASVLIAVFYFLVLPLVWLGCLGPQALGKDLALELGPTFAPLLGGVGRFAAMSFIILNMFMIMIAPVSSACRTLSQLADDGLMPRAFSRRNRFDAPYVAILFTSASSIVFLLLGVPLWLIAGACMCYLIGISMPSIAVWLLRKNEPDMPRPYRAPRGTIMLGVVAAFVWLLSIVLGFEQFGLPTVIFGIFLAYCGAALYAWRKWTDRRRAGLPVITRSLHVKLTGAMLLVLVLDGAGYLMAVNSIDEGAHPALVSALADIFVVVALLTISVGLVLPGMIAHSAVEVSKAANHLVKGTLADFTRAMEALAAGNLEGAHARVDIQPVRVTSRDEVGQMAVSFNTLQDEVKRAALGLDGAREGLRYARNQLTEINTNLEQRVVERTAELEVTHNSLVKLARRAGMAEVATGVLHNVGNVLNSINVSTSIVVERLQKSRVSRLSEVAKLLTDHAADLPDFLTRDERGRNLPEFLAQLAAHLDRETREIAQEMRTVSENVEHIKGIVHTQQSYAGSFGVLEPIDLRDSVEDALRIQNAALNRHEVNIVRELKAIPTVVVDKHKVLQILVNLISNAKHAMSDSLVKTLTIKTYPSADGGIELSVHDTGSGIVAENITRIFAHGFTTKKDGHGFGLHSSALAAKEMNATLIASSDGAGLGAVFTLKFPPAVPKQIAA